MNDCNTSTSIEEVALSEEKETIETSLDKSNARIQNMKDENPLKENLEERAARLGLDLQTADRKLKTYLKELEDKDLNYWNEKPKLKKTWTKCRQ